MKFLSSIRVSTCPTFLFVGYGLDYNEKYRNLQFIAEFNKDGQ